MAYPCPNCGVPMKRMLPPNGGKPWHCTAQCENATNPSKEVKEIGTSSGSNQKRRFIVPGSGKMNYTVVQLYHTPDPTREWQCSCPAWTRHVPRTDCKHIVRVKVEKMNNPDGDKYKALAAMLKSTGFTPEAIKSLVKQPSVPVKSKPAAGGRKFR